MPAKTKDKTVVLAARIEIGEDAAAQLASTVASEESISDKLGRIASEVLTEIARGGMLVDAATMDRIQKIATVGRGSDFLPLVERAMHRRNGRYLAEYPLDDIWEKAIGDVAARRGQTIQRVVQDCMNQAFGMKWFFPEFVERRVRPNALYFDQDGMAQLAEALGKPPDEITGRDVLNYVASEFSVFAPKGKE